MAKRAKKNQKQSELVAVTITEDFEQARNYLRLLKSNDIQAMIREQDDETNTDRVFAILVPEEHIDEAHVIIESEDSYDEFYGFEEDDDDENYLDVDYLGEDEH